eukprot:TRINITY_DN39472_c0_g1_i2.p1 TRINITY_DN39472_c0_g1~~TRINITY_DN39472_c0_g1_i2.p1  ORF type:complete len:482 (+),score=140.32 TRINITY_DN39472_c0_g1_i2:111-1556(+)
MCIRDRQKTLAEGNAEAVDAAIYLVVQDSKAIPLSLEDATPVFAALAPGLPESTIDAAASLVPFLITPETLSDETTRGLIGFGLVHPRDSVKLAVLEAITSLLGVVTTQGMAQTFLDSVIALSGAESTNVWTAAAKLLRKAAREAAVVQYLFTAETCTALSGVEATQKLRALELYAAIATDSDAGFELCSSAGQLNRMLAAWSQPDVLVRLNALEILASLSMSQKGLAWLQEQGLIQEMLQLLCQKDSLDAALLVPSILKAFSKILHQSPDSAPALLEGGTLGAVLAQMLEACNSDGELAMSVLGMLTRSAGGLDALSKTINLPALLADKLNSPEHSQRTAALLCCTNLLQSTSEQLQATAQAVDQAVLQSVGLPLVGVLIKQSAQPIEELQVAALTALAGLAEREWGVRMILGHGGAAESILDRTHANQCKEAKEWRYALVKQMLQFRDLLPSSELLTSLVQFEVAGPFVASSCVVPASK